jgi:hypothetical protein
MVSSQSATAQKLITLLHKWSNVSHPSFINLINTSAHLNPTFFVFKQFARRLFNWQSIIILLLLDKLAITIFIKDTSQNCKKELKKCIFTDLSFYQIHWWYFVQK